MTTLYVAGPMTWLPDFNFPAFRAAEEELRSCGFDVRSPTDCDGGSQDKSWDFYMRLALRMLLECEGVAVLPGWENSRGARIEVSLADALGMPVRVVDAWRESA